MNRIYTPERNYKVLAICMTYNQSKYIVDALNGFAIQKTGFPFVCLILDDASTDGEQDVIKAWMDRECDMVAAQYEEIEDAHIIIVPHLTNKNCTFVVYFLKKNLFNNPRKVELMKPWRDVCEYEALCEGDDYWICASKLQKQVDYLDSHPDCSCCVHEYEEFLESSHSFKEHQLYYLRDFVGEGIIISLSMFCEGIFCTKTLTAIYRIHYLQKSKYQLYQYQFDMVMFYALATQGYIYLMNDTMGVYRINKGGITNKSAFHKASQYQMFNLASVENTHYSRMFAYNYIKKSILSMFLGDFNIFFMTAKYLGNKYTFLLMFKDLPSEVFRIIQSKYFCC